MKNLIPSFTAMYTLGLSVLMLAGCATRPPRQIGPPPKPVMPPVAEQDISTLPPPEPIDFENDPMVQQALVLPSAPAPQPRKGTSYTVKKGESLSAIAARHNMSWRKLADYNYITNPDRIRAGQVILIPGDGRPVQGSSTVQNTTSRTPPAAASGSTYVVQAGDSLSVVARRYSTTVSKLKSVNGLSSDRLLVGQVLKLPSGASATGGSTETPSAPRPTPVPPRPTPTPSAGPDPLEMEEPATEDPVDQATEVDPMDTKAFPIVVQEGDTLESIAKNYIVPVEEIRKLNNLAPNAEVEPGQKLNIPPSVY